MSAEAPATLNGSVSVKFAATSTSGSSSSTAVAITPSGRIVVDSEAGGATAFLRTGIGAQTAVTTDKPILAGTSQTFSVPANHTHAAVITEAGTATIWITPVTGE